MIRAGIATTTGTAKRNTRLECRRSTRSTRLTTKGYSLTPQFVIGNYRLDFVLDSDYGLSDMKSVVGQGIEDCWGGLNIQGQNVTITKIETIK